MDAGELREQICHHLVAIGGIWTQGVEAECLMLYNKLYPEMAPPLPDDEELESIRGKAITDYLMSTWMAPLPSQTKPRESVQLFRASGSLVHGVVGSTSPWFRFRRDAIEYGLHLVATTQWSSFSTESRYYDTEMAPTIFSLDENKLRHGGSLDEALSQG